MLLLYALKLYYLRNFSNCWRASTSFSRGFSSPHSLCASAFVKYRGTISGISKMFRTFSIKTVSFESAKSGHLFLKNSSFASLRSFSPWKIPLEDGQSSTQNVNWVTGFEFSFSSWRTPSADRRKGASLSTYSRNFPTFFQQSINS